MQLFGAVPVVIELMLGESILADNRQIERSADL